MKRRLFLTLAALGGIAALFARNKAYYHGTSPNFVNGVFVDKEGSPPKSFTDLLKWNWEAREKRQAWPSSVSVQQVVPPQRAEFRVTFLGHASWLYQIDGINILIDPVYSERAGPFGMFGPKRVCASGIKIDDLPPLDYILITHNHYDHLDGEALRVLSQKHEATIITPLGNDTIIRDFVGDKQPILTLDWGNETRLKNEIALHCEPCRHWSARGLFDRNKALWACFVMASSKGNILHIGDTGFGTGAHFRNLKAKFKSFALAILPIGAYEPRWFMKDQHINPAEAIEILNITGATKALASHWGTFQLTDEGRENPVQDLHKTGVDKDKFSVLEVGGVYEAS
jgi:L-ascorbate metabolism protein UlaG (beta-lactamase superfamily)